MFMILGYVCVCINCLIISISIIYFLNWVVYLFKKFKLNHINDHPFQWPEVIPKFIDDLGKGIGFVNIVFLIRKFRDRELC